MDALLLVFVFSFVGFALGYGFGYDKGYEHGKVIGYERCKIDNDLTKS